MARSTLSISTKTTATTTTTTTSTTKSSSASSSFSTFSLDKSLSNTLSQNDLDNDNDDDASSDDGRYNGEELEDENMKSEGKCQQLDDNYHQEESETRAKSLPSIDSAGIISTSSPTLLSPSPPPSFQSTPTPQPLPPISSPSSPSSSSSILLQPISYNELLINSDGNSNGNNNNNSNDNNMEQKSGTIMIGPNAFYESFFSQKELERFFPDHRIRLSVITWNMGCKPPNDYNRSIQELLHLKPYRYQKPQQPQQNNQLISDNNNISNRNYYCYMPELFAIGLQETPTSEMIVEQIKVSIQAALGPNYVLLKWSSIGVLHCSIWLRRELLWSCSTVRMVPIHTRPMAANRIRTKGAIALSFCLFGTSFLFINTHLTAHEINLRTRINQLDKVQQILNLKYPLVNHLKSNSENNLIDKLSSSINNSNNFGTGTISNNNSNHMGNHSNYINNIGPQEQQNKMIRDHQSEYIFWFGDLNFRLELPMDIVLDTIKCIKNINNFDRKITFLNKLMRSDQLSNLMNRGMIFQGFEEAQWPPKFLPTYKCKISQSSSSIMQQDFDIQNLISSSPSSKLDSIDSDLQNINGKHDEDDDNDDNDYRKFQENNNNLDEFVANYYNIESGRVPSYTDRILFQSKSNLNYNDGDHDPINCIYYNSIENISSSDHKPVLALFELVLDGGGGSGGAGSSLSKKNPASNPRKLSLLDENNIHNSANDNENGKDKSTRNQNQSQPPQSSTSSSPSSKFSDQTGFKKPGGGSGNFRKIIKKHRNLFSVNRFKQQNLNNSISNLNHNGMKQQQQQDFHGNDNNTNISRNGSGNSSPSSSTPLSLSPINGSPSPFDRLGQLNAGAYERKIYIEGLKLLNTFMQNNSSIEDSAFRLKPRNLIQQQQQLQKQQKNRQQIIQKSHSFGSTEILVDPTNEIPAETKLSNGNVKKKFSDSDLLDCDNQKHHDQQQKLSNHIETTKSTTKEQNKTLSNDRTSSVCVVI